MKKVTRLNYVGILLSKRDDLCEAGPVQAGIGTLLILYCFREMNGGIIAGCRNWQARRWIFTCGLDEAPAGDCPGLWHWEGDDLFVDLYSAELEEAAGAASDKARTAAQARWRRHGEKAAAADAGKAEAEEDEEEESAADCVADASADAPAYTRADAINLINKIPPLLPRAFGGGGREGERVSEDAWIAAVAGAHPATALMDAAHLADNVRAAARAAFRRVKNPAAVLAEVPRLTAYLTQTKVDETLRGRRFFRPQMPLKFFESLEQTITEARSWAKETGWKPKGQSRTAAAPQAASVPAGDVMSEEEVAEFFAEVKEKRA